MSELRTNYTVEKLEASNWESWKIHMQVLLEERGLWDYVAGKKTKPVTDSTSSEEDKKGLVEWERDDGKARRQIIMAMSGGEVRGIGGATTSKALWDLLCARKESVGSVGLNSALAALFRAKAETEGDIPEHLKEIKDLQERIHSSGLKYDLDLPDWIFTAIMINSLPASWDSFTAAYAGTIAFSTGTTEKSPYRVKSHEMEAILMDEWRRRNPGGSVVAETALMTKRGVRDDKRVPFSDRRCYACGKKGHIARNCPEEKESSEDERREKKEHVKSAFVRHSPFDISY